MLTGMFSIYSGVEFLSVHSANSATTLQHISLRAELFLLYEPSINASNKLSTSAFSST